MNAISPDVHGQMNNELFAIFIKKGLEPFYSVLPGLSWLQTALTTDERRTASFVLKRAYAKALRNHGDMIMMASGHGPHILHGLHALMPLLDATKAVLEQPHDAVIAPIDIEKYSRITREIRAVFDPT